ncbi:MAG: hypothetical protein A2381_18040 [Bdellovibrionales bacterium RIFOXYB1_FULL_37_110]|nr:MAG: hypothetical protein A2417_06505 [Bdellovibrionales bacterium RIFOXYC1_FULL_37_79]OFZ58574.1 MAG: hypothetical protein A2381_18040 [Bdellovibrionales bacterium RIFOXYB1_FULL_37_110]OFZ61764.1 MAG: hypothetical protein A2577_19650 [Bdellovibrionales bacterium RIFOXYD1_FULL_36_51]
MKKLHTICFIGSDKNAGKTTAFNFIYAKLGKKKINTILLSIGVNGEDFDSLENHIKPKIVIKKDDYFITEQNRVKGLDGLYDVVKIFSPPNFKKIYILSRAHGNLPIVLEGPNEKHEILKIKEFLGSYFDQANILLDGSIDRQFIASEEISDEFYFSLLITERLEQIKKIKNLIRPLAYEVVVPPIKSFIKKHSGDQEKTIIFDESLNIIYKGLEISFLDKNLLTQLKKNATKKIYIYLNGALTNHLWEMLSPFKNLTLILNSFTQELISHLPQFKENSIKKLLLNQVKLSGIFLREETSKKSDIFLPENVPVYNLFREEAFDEVRI